MNLDQKPSKRSFLTASTFDRYKTYTVLLMNYNSNYNKKKYRPFHEIIIIIVIIIVIIIIIIIIKLIKVMILILMIIIKQ